MNELTLKFLKMIYYESILQLFFLLKLVLDKALFVQNNWKNLLFILLLFFIVSSSTFDVNWIKNAIIYLQLIFIIKHIPLSLVLMLFLIILFVFFIYLFLFNDLRLSLVIFDLILITLNSLGIICWIWHLFPLFYRQAY